MFLCCVLQTVDGDCAGRLLAYMIDELGWFELGDFAAASGGEEDGLDGEVQRAVELLCASEGRLTPPLVALLLDYAGRAQLCFRRFMSGEDAKDKEGAASAARARQAVIATVAASRVRIQGGVVVQPPEEQQREAKGDAKGA